MKKIKYRAVCILTVFSMLICIFTCQPAVLSAADNTGRINIDSEVSGMTWKLYRVGGSRSDGRIDPLKIFSGFSIPTHFDFREEIQNLAVTFSNYISLKNVTPERTGVTDENGDIVFTDLPEGWYTAVPSDTEINENVVSSSPVMICISSLSIFSGTWGTDVRVCPKIRTRQKLSFKDIIIKFVDEGPNRSDEPVTIVIYRENEEYDRVELGPDNDWTFVIRDVPDDDTEWYIIQHDSPSPDAERYPVYHRETSEIDNTPTDIHILIHTNNPNSSITPPNMMTQVSQEVTEKDSPVVTDSDSEDSSNVSGGPYVSEPEDSIITGGPVTDITAITETDNSTVTEAVTTTLRTSSDSGLPQTGQLWWPVPVMALSGVFLAAVGAAVKRKDGE